LPDARVIDVPERSRFAGHTEYLELVPQDMRAEFELSADV
jgi:hypothetical protein